MNDVISPDEFYQAAILDEAPVASFEAVKKRQQDGSVMLIDLRSVIFGVTHKSYSVNRPNKNRVPSPKI